MESFLHAVRILGQGLWQAVLRTANVDDAAEREAALEIAGHVMRFVDDLSTIVAASYSTEAQGVSSDRAVLRRDLLDALIAGQGDTERIRRLARTLRVRLGESYVVVLVRGPDTVPEDHQGLPLTTRIALRRLVEAARAPPAPARGHAARRHAAGRGRRAVPGGAGARARAIKQECDALAAALVDADPETDAWIGFSSWHEGMAAIAVGLRGGARRGRDRDGQRDPRPGGGVQRRADRPHGPLEPARRPDPRPDDPARSSPTTASARATSSRRCASTSTPAST